MIKTKEDLAGKYALRSDTEVFALFAEKCNGFGWFYGNLDGEDAHSCPETECVNADLSDNTLTHCTEVYYIREGYKKLTLADFQDTSIKVSPLPVKTKTEYAPVTESIFSLQEDFEQGNLYFSWQGCSKGLSYDKIVDEKMLLCRYEEKRLLRKVVTDYTWKDSLQEYLASQACLSSIKSQSDLPLDAPRKTSSPDFIAELDLFGGNYLLSEGEFLELCKVVVSNQ